MSLFSRFPFLQRTLLWFKDGHAGRSFFCLNVSQFLAATNANMYKLLLVYMLIDIYGESSASSILSGVGALFVIPFLLFSSTAGILADRLSKQRILLTLKFGETLIMLLSVFVFKAYNAWAGCLLLFALSMHNTIYGPAKMGIISEIVPKEKVSRANGIITAFTYLAAILGTFFASLMTDLSDRTFSLATLFCLALACFGLIFTLGIHRTLPQGSSKKIDFRFLQEIYATLRFARTRKHLLFSMMGSAFFVTIGTFTQLNAIPFAIQSLHLTAVQGGYLFLFAGIGIAIGAYFAGKVSKIRIELGLSCLAAFILGILFISLFLLSFSLVSVIILLLFLGAFGGAFVVPCDTYTQMTSPTERKGQVIATANFLSFSGVLFASLVLYVFNTFLNFSSAESYAFMGLLTIALGLFMTLRLSDYSLPFFSKVLLHPFYQIEVEGRELLEKSPSPLLILQRPTWKSALLLFGALPETHLFIPKKSKKPIKNTLLYSIHFVKEGNIDEMIETVKDLLQEDLVPCLFLKNVPFSSPSDLSYTPILVDFHKTNSHLLLRFSLPK